jgi:hypothetical protein
VFAFGAYDLLKERGDTLFASEFYRADFRYDHAHDRGRARAAVTLGFDRTYAGLLVPEDPRNVVDRSLAARAELEHQIAQSATLRAGADGALDDYTIEGVSYVDPDLPEASQFERVFPARTDYVAGAWLDLVWDTGNVEITPGVRADIYGSGSDEAVGIDPRLAARVHVTESVRLLTALGFAHQAPSFVVPLPGVAPVLGRGLQRSMQASAGAEADLDSIATAGASVFFNKFLHMSDAFGAGGNNADNDLDVRSEGEAYGVELFLRRRLTKRFGGFLSYTLSRSVRRVEDREFVSAFDRTHVLNAALSYDLGRGWRTGARVLYYTGMPAWGDDRDPIDVGLHDVDREPAYVRLDLRLEKRWVIGNAAWASFVAEFLNATLNKETWPGGERVGPVSIPSIGVEAGF